jgi:Spy/CpxP family protein refolding chaperone
VRNRIWIVLLVVSLGINIGFLLHWFWPKNGPGYSPGEGQSQLGWHVGPMRRGLGLDSKQARLMENERRQVLVQAQPLQEQLRQKRRELFLLLKSKAVTGAELDLALNEISRLQTAIEKLFILHSLKMKGFLTPSQLEKYNGFFEHGLCPGMMSEKACPTGQGAMAGREQPAPACDNPCPAKK